MINQEMIARKTELFAPIDQQIMMTDNVNDLLLLGSNMLGSSINIFINQYGKDGTISILKQMIADINNSR